jgi:hypothetical protein
MIVLPVNRIPLTRGEVSMATVEQVERPAWVSGAVAVQILGCSRKRLLKLAADKRLSTRTLPGSYTRYRLDELTTLAAEHTEAAEAE